MANDEGTKGAARKRSAAATAGVTATAAALFAVAIFLGTRHAGDAGPPGGASPPVAAEKVTAPAVAAEKAAAPAVAAEKAAAPPMVGPNRQPRRLERANRQELETTLPKGAPVDVTANDGDPEAFRLAQEIHAFLLSKGYQVAEVTRSVSTPPAKGVGLEPLAGGRWRVIVGSADE
jgi:hypothetical protein